MRLRRLIRAEIDGRGCRNLAFKYKLQPAVEFRLTAGFFVAIWPRKEEHRAGYRIDKRENGGG